MKARKSHWLFWIGSAMFCLFLAACGSGSSSYTANSPDKTASAGGSDHVLLKVPVPETFNSDFCARIRVSGTDFPEIIMDKSYPAASTSIEGVVPNIKMGENRTVELGLFADNNCRDLSLADWYGKKTGVSINASDVTIVQIALQKFQVPDTGSIVVRGDKNLILRRLHGEVVLADTSPIGSALCRIVESGVEIGTVNSGIDPSNLGVINTLVEVNTNTAQLELFCTHPLYSQAGQEFADLIVIPADPLYGTFTATVEMNELAAASLPVFKVVGNPVNKAAAEQLQKSLGLNYNPLAADGSVRFLDSEKFLALPSIQLGAGEPDDKGNPTILEAHNFDAIKLLPYIEQAEALKISQAALRAAGLSAETAGGLMKPSIQTGHTLFEALNTDGVVLARKNLDTHVQYFFTLNGIPVIGPGAKISLSFNGDGKATEVNYALKTVQQGEMMPLIPLNQSDKFAQRALLGIASSQGGQQGPIKVGPPQVVYFAADSFFDVTAIYPHYLYTGSMRVGDEEVVMRSVLVLAVNAGPSLNLQASADGSLIVANAGVKGGTPPYQFSWSSSTTELGPPLSSQGPDISYDFNPKEPGNSETLSLQVTDADGLTAQASAIIAVLSPPVPTLAKAKATAYLAGVIDFGSEWIGTCAGLPGSSGDAAGFVNNMSAAGFVNRFNWGNNAAWEQDFKDSVFPGGDDLHWTDNTDIIFYSGHANGDGFVFCNPSHTDTFLHFNDARWGNQDLDWLVIAACGPLQPMSSGLAWWQRWGPSFDGLHLLMGYASSSYDNTSEGRLLSNWMLGYPLFLGLTLPPIPVRSAWVQAANGSQPHGVTWAIMGAYGPNWINNYNDYFHSRGTVGPEIHIKWGYWKISGTT